MRRWLVTGGCGFIGINLVAQLLERGDSVRVLDDLSVGSRDDLLAVASTREADVELVVGDVRDHDAVAGALDGVDVVAHLAAQSGVVQSIADPSSDFDVNVVGLQRVLIGARDAGVERFVFASSNAVLGVQEPPLNERMAPRPRTPYGASKLAGEALCQAYAASFGLGTVALRFANAYGPHASHKDSVVARCFRRAIDESAVVIEGDGQQTRDFVYVDDLARAIVAAAEGDRRGEVYHVGSGVETEVGDLVRAVAARVESDRGGEVAVERAPARAGEPRRSVADISRADEELDWRPKVALDDGLGRTSVWFGASRGWQTR